MSREMIVGAEHIVGARHRDYDELIEMSGDPQTALVHQSAHAAAHPHHLHPQHHHHPHPHHAPHHHGYAPAPQQVHYDVSHQPPPQSAPVEHRKRLVVEEPTHERQFPIGFVYENVDPGEEVEVEAKPQVYFRGERLALAPSIARDFQIVDIKVGKDSQLAASGVMPGESFSALAVDVRMQLNTAKPGIVITIRVRNRSNQRSNFEAVLYGAVLE